jgi:hypothetical protein
MQKTVEGQILDQKTSHLKFFAGIIECGSFYLWMGGGGAGAGAWIQMLAMRQIWA